jgi:hypothetical protein
MGARRKTRGRKNFRPELEILFSRDELSSRSIPSLQFLTRLGFDYLSRMTSVPGADLDSGGGLASRPRKKNNEA